MNVRTIMSQPAITCRRTESANDAARLMWQHDIGAVPVVDEAGALIGVVTDRDICMGAYTQGRDLSSIPVERVASGAAVACKASDSLSDALALMRKHQIHRLPVVDKRGAVTGMVSLADVVRVVIRTDVRHDDVDFVRTMAAICQPRANSLVASGTPN